MKPKGNKTLQSLKKSGVIRHMSPFGEPAKIGKNYFYVTISTVSQSNAKTEAKKIREKGHLARIHKSKMGGKHTANKYRGKYSYTVLAGRKRSKPVSRPKKKITRKKPKKELHPLEGYQDFSKKNLQDMIGRSKNGKKKFKVVEVKKPDWWHTGKYRKMWEIRKR